MAARKMTFSLPDALAAELIKSVAARDRSRYVADALRARLSAWDEELALACDVANRSVDVRSIEREFDVISAEIVEPWTNGPSR
jgi:hypothetical protein